MGTALAWSWLDVATTLLVGFCALLRPTEYLPVCFRDQALPCEHAAGLFLFVGVPCHKTSRRGPRRTHVRVDEPTVVEFLRWRAGRLPSWMPIYSGSATTWRRRLDILTRTLTGKSRLILPSSLRPGAATYFFEAWGENVPKLQWRGRWQCTKTLEHYIQELVPYRILAEVAPTLRDRLETLANMFDETLLEVMGRNPA